MNDELKNLLLEAARIYYEWQEAQEEQKELRTAHNRAIEDSPEWLETYDVYMESVGKRNDLWGEHLKIEKKLYKYITKEIK